MTNQKGCDIIYKSLASVWEHSSVGRASALQAGGHRFEPYCSHHSGPVAQLVRAPACHAGGRGFEPHPGRHYTDSPCLASVAQLVEQGTENPRVVGSIPTGGTTFADLAHLVERRLAKAKVAGSSPVIRSRKSHGHEENTCPLIFVSRTIERLPVYILMSRPMRAGNIRPMKIWRIWRHSQVVRQRSAKPLSPGSNPGGASKKGTNHQDWFSFFVLLVNSRGDRTRR